MKQYIEGEYLITEYDNGTVTRLLNNPVVIKNPLTRLQFRSLFHLTELANFYTLAKADVTADIIKDDLMSAESINLDDPRTHSALDYLEATGCITAARRTEILT